MIPATPSTTWRCVLVVAGALLALPAVAVGDDRWERHWNARVAAFEKENAALAADARTAVFVGDSITEGFRLAKHFPGKAVLNRGISADRIGVAGPRGVLRRLDASVFDCRPAIVFILIGVNDLAGSNIAPEKLADGFATLVAKIRERLPEVRVVVQTVLPTARKYRHHARVNPRIVAYNASLRAFAEKEGLPVVDLFELYADEDGFLPDDLSNDGLHLRPDAFERWAEAVRPLLP